MRVALPALALIIALSFVTTAEASHHPYHFVNYPTYAQPLPNPLTDEWRVKHYGYPDNQLRWSTTEYQVYTSPYRAARGALHPYYRNTYYTARPRTRRVTHPQFYQYLSDLYYNGELGNGTPRTGGYDFGARDAYWTDPTLGCTNYRYTKTSQFTPQRFEGCL